MKRFKSFTFVSRYRQPGCTLVRLTMFYQLYIFCIIKRQDDMSKEMGRMEKEGVVAYLK